MSNVCPEERRPGGIIVVYDRERPPHFPGWNITGALTITPSVQNKYIRPASGRTRDDGDNLLSISGSQRYIDVPTRRNTKQR